MNCHKNNKEDNKHSSLKHILHMLLCCGLPIVIMIFLPVITKYSSSLGGFLGKIAPFICPVMMIFMMYMMMRGNNKRSCCNNSKSENDTKEIL
ncbi:hypothetical protein [Clostridium cylindrosporum]|uniref:DUF2933 domain-containing protein n=1 Tax=Clostridium cylindrosporum DSM 605 TaxID=1121307 RepID=A0A0J8DAZ8_CLOCY|nr:hypothetical protein [Clostridium cylindrosporum]KMT23240.1 hypothetical protein CLCY_6c01210 [Clostridium cylindrosporum DSM 605]